jgi:tetratricopeptide (TPR) repeat protein
MTPPMPAHAVEAVAWLRSEVAATDAKPRQARLLGEVGEIEERNGDEPSAARDYLAAFNADPTFREPLEGLVRLLERRRSYKNLGKVIDALVRASKKPEEAARALLMKAAYAADVSGDLAAAREAATQAAKSSTAGPESALAWLTLEILAGKLGDPELRREALARRVEHTSDVTWRGLLLIDLGHLVAETGDVDEALALFRQAQALGGGATFHATNAARSLVRRNPGEGHEATDRTRACAAVLVAQGDLIREACADPARGDVLGVPRWCRSALHMVDAWLRAAEAMEATGDLTEAARVLDTAMAAVPAADPAASAEEDQGERFIRAALAEARLRVAERLGDEALAAGLAEYRLADEADPRVASTFAYRVADHALHLGEYAAAQKTLQTALRRDPASIATRAMATDLLGATADAAELSRELEGLLPQLETADARARALLVAALLAGTEGGDSARARELLKTATGLAPSAGIPSAPGIAARLGRLIGAVRGDSALFEEATRELLDAGADESEHADLWFEVLRATFARGAVTDAEVCLQTLAEAQGGAWLAAALEAFLPGRDADQSAALDDLAALEAGRAAELTLLAAIRAEAQGDDEGARRRLRYLRDAAPDHVLVVTYLAELERASGAHAAAAETAGRGAAATDDPELAAALYLEAGLDRWRAGERARAIECFVLAEQTAPAAAMPLLRWASRGVEGGTLEGRRAAIERATQAGEDPFALALERFATELAGGEPGPATDALLDLRDAPEGPLRVAGELAHVVVPAPAFSPEAAAVALRSLGALGDVSATAAAAEAFRTALEADAGVDELSAAARTWLDVGGGIAAALEWLAASLGTRDEVAARRAVAALFTGEDREALLASAALLEAHTSAWSGARDVEGDSAAARLVNLELATPGVDLPRRAQALARADAPLGADGAAVGMSGWSLLAEGKTAEALSAFRSVTTSNPADLAAWAGAHAAARLLSDKVTQVAAASALGERCADASRGAKFWEEAGLMLMELGNAAEAEAALEHAFARDPSRTVAFDRLFRRVRERKDGEKLLDLIGKRLDFSDDPAEIVKLYWERSRVLREKGDVDGAMVALENVTMVEPDHVGALALSGEIFIRRGQFAEAADALGRLAKIEDAPPKNRATAGIAAVDLYENKLDRPDLALEILVVLHKASLTNMAVRERLARAAAKTGSWKEAAGILEELMLERTTPAGRMEAAQLAMAIRRDRLNDRAGASKAMVKLLEESPAHGDAVDLLLDAPVPDAEKKRLLLAARAGLLDEVAREPTRGPSVRRLARVARATGDASLEQTALAASAVLGALDDAGRGALQRLSQSKPRFPQIALTDALLRTVVAKGDDGPIAELFAALGPTLAEALGPTLTVMGVGRRERVDPRAGSTVRQEIAAWAGALGVAEFELYVGGRDPLGVQGIPGEPHSLVVGADVRSPFPLATRARVARELFAMTRGTTVLRLRDETTAQAIVVAACKLAEVPIDAPAFAVQAEVDRLVGKAIARKTRKQIVEICQRVVQTKADARAWSQRAIATLDRIAAIATGDVGVVLGDIIGQDPHKLADVVVGDRRSEELLRFALSPGYLDVRRTLGLEAPS